MFRSVLTFFLGSQSDAELFNRIFGFVLPVGVSIRHVEHSWLDVVSAIDNLCSIFNICYPIGGVFATILVTWMVNKLVHRIDLQYVFVWLNILFLSIFNVIPSLWAQVLEHLVLVDIWIHFVSFSLLEVFFSFFFWNRRRTDFVFLVF